MLSSPSDPLLPSPFGHTYRGGGTDSIWAAVTIL
jgi:hypothetical protein